MLIQNLNRIAALVSIASLLALCVTGCHTPSQPWAGIPYQPPQGLENPARATYAPMPAFLPGRRAIQVDPQAQDEQLELMLFGESESTTDLF